MSCTAIAIFPLPVLEICSAHFFLQIPLQDLWSCWMASIVDLRVFWKPGSGRIIYVLYACTPVKYLLLLARILLTTLLDDMTVHSSLLSVCQHQVQFLLVWTNTSAGQIFSTSLF